MGLLDSLNPVKAIIDSVKGVIDELSTTDEEKGEIKLKLDRVGLELETAVMGFKAQIAEHQAKVIITEAKGGWLQRNWRPCLMFVFMAILVNNYVLLPYIPGVNPLVFETAFWGLLTVGVGGYIGSRGYEKKQVTDLLKKNDTTELTELLRVIADANK
jgi:hypothetical protein